MRTFRTLVAAVAVTTLLHSAPAHAFGDTCRAQVKATGKSAHSMHGAHHNAIHAWEHAVRHMDGRRFADWYYSGDRTLACSWPADGRHITCVASALPCAPGRS